MPSCSYEVGVDYQGIDITSATANVDAPDDCGRNCALHEECMMFSWVPKDPVTGIGPVCWLKSSGVARAHDGRISGTCSGTVSQHGATLQEHYVYQGNDLQDGQFQLSSMSGCADLCRSFPGCEFFTFYYWGGWQCPDQAAGGTELCNCWLKTAKPADPTYVYNTVSGQIVTPKPTPVPPVITFCLRWTWQHQ